MFVSDRVGFNPEQSKKNWRVAVVALINLYLSIQRTISNEGELGPTEILIYATVATANVQKLMRERTIPLEYAGTAVLPREWVVPISRNAIAEATGLPRETVRRNVARMIERGLLIDDERGGVTQPIGVIEDRGVEPVLDAMLVELLRAIERLQRVGVLEIRSNGNGENGG
jgi:hypothetical protein